jgi:hypothetical protein
MASSLSTTYTGDNKRQPRVEEQTLVGSGERLLCRGQEAVTAQANLHLLKTFLIVLMLSTNWTQKVTGGTMIPLMMIASTCSRYMNSTLFSQTTIKTSFR